MWISAVVIASVLATPLASGRLDLYGGWASGVQDDGGPGYTLGGLGVLGGDAVLSWQMPGWGLELVADHRRFAIIEDATGGPAVSLPLWRGRAGPLAWWQWKALRLFAGLELEGAELFALTSSSNSSVAPVAATRWALWLPLRAQVAVTPRWKLEANAGGTLLSTTNARSRSGARSGGLAGSVGLGFTVLESAAFASAIWLRGVYVRDTLSFSDADTAVRTTTAEMRVGLGWEVFFRPTTPARAAPPIDVHGRLRLTVQDAATREALHEAEVRVGGSLYYSDASGVVSLVQLSPGPVDVHVSSPQHAPRTVRLEIRAGQEELAQVLLDPTTTESGVVSGQIVDQVTQAPVRANIRSSSSASGELTTRPDGTFRLELPPGQHQLFIQAPGYVPLVQNVEARAGVPLEVRWSLEKTQ